MKAIGIIPVRVESSRLPQKALIDICGLPMIAHTFFRAKLSNALDELYVATDSDRIKDIIENIGGKVIMTGSFHKTGSDRIAEAAKSVDADIIVNIQGDEPLLNPEHVTLAVEALKNDANVNIAVLVTPYQVKNSDSDIKAVLDLNDFILYCSRNDLPSDKRTLVKVMWKMCFIVPFRKDFLLQYTSWEQTPLEKIEFNEYLRILEHGYKIKAVRVEQASISVDTPKDLEIVRSFMVNDKIFNEYCHLWNSL
ncbi:MAG: 3-deoxy-manno-octulosonate cytidylyltransferase [Candidatus Omnitrophica bacterium]|nr:3-deoxy-manno-octulosonate cytidylyltransferase [Candidatus Omnitrophota bacterium]